MEFARQRQLPGIALARHDVHQQFHQYGRDVVLAEGLRPVRAGDAFRGDVDGGVPAPQPGQTVVIDGMGGSTSEQYKQFKQYCFTAYTTLRKSSNLILNLFSLMVDANIPDIKLEPDKVVLKVKERFHLEMSEPDS